MALVGPIVSLGCRGTVKPGGIASLMVLIVSYGFCLISSGGVLFVGYFSAH